MSADSHVVAHGAEPAFRQHHFINAEQQFSTSKLGMWLLLATEVLMFGGLFVGYGLMQGIYPEAWVAGHHHLDRPMGALNTVFLLISSYTMVMAVHYASTSNKAKTLLNLFLTLGFAAGFLVVKYFEYSHKFHDGLLPGRFFSYHGGGPPQQAMFFGFYFCMTGLHGIHVVIGMGLIAWIMMRTARGEFSSAYYTPVDLVGLYWHLVDLIWIYLFPLLYLVS
jgi:cytochrome c oxidase subunit 3